jgi:uncharacterized RDD family membrane protein YckC
MEDMPGYAWEIEAAAYRPDYTFERAELASWAERLLAALIDVLVYAWPVGVALAVGSAPFSALCTLVAVGIALLLSAWEGRTGHGPGKAALRLRLVDADSGQLVGPGRGALRRIGHALDTLSCYVGYLWPLWDAQRQTFADKAARTVVLSG